MKEDNKTDLTRRVDRLEVYVRDAVDAKNQALRSEVTAALERLEASIANMKVALMIWVALVVGLGVAILGFKSDSHHIVIHYPSPADQAAADPRTDSG